MNTRDELLKIMDAAKNADPGGGSMAATLLAIGASLRMLADRIDRLEAKLNQ